MSPVNRRHLLTAAGLTAAAAAGCSTTAPPPGNIPTPASGGLPASGDGSPPASAPATPDRPAIEIVHGPRDRPAVALTFHGQGTTAQVVALLAALETGGARGTVLAVGAWLAQAPDLAARITAHGHELGNHTQHHIDIAHRDAAATYAEINDCATVLRDLTGSPGRWFRPSQTRHSTALIRVQAARAGYGTCLSYDVDSLDYTDPGPAAVVRTTLKSVQKGSIVSMHCGHDGTIHALPEVLTGLRVRGLRAVTVTELLA
ncbi:polysaccharide deacetylase family protein [Hamadaea tsunoensis]|uniref:polysaccharide deacetylase family protein n=1 Tax=Hamadaea tsunoensis TaxID=53368 RepID=UPI000412D7D4|nr:polysaccharide deacetylase family protein [Hamadaea tsunoensis]